MNIIDISKISLNIYQKHISSEHMGSIFNSRKILHGLPKEGQKIKFVKPTKFAFHTDVIENEKLLEFGKEYTVKQTELNSSSTYVHLEEFWDDDMDMYRNNQKAFSMGAFEWTLPEINPDELIGLSPIDMSILSKTYGIGIEMDELPYIQGNPTLIVEYERIRWRITKAFWKAEAK
jgi:hypothetical protein